MSDTRDETTSAFTTLWNADQCRRLATSGIVGSPLSITFGGPHQSAPRFSRAGVRPGDLVYPINVRAGRLRVLARFRVAGLIPVEALVARSPEPFREFDARDPLVALEHWIEADPRLAAQCPGEADEVVEVTDSTRITLDALVPAPDVVALRWQSGRRPARPIKHLDPDGLITSTLSLQGVYCLANGSAAILDAALGQ
jgi:hypothetical protein